MNSAKRIALLTGALSLALSAVTATAQPNDHPGNSKNKAERGQAPAQQYHRHHGPSVDIGAVRITLRNHRDLLAPASSLPPGIQKNLARGKPLPPRIAKNLDNRLLGHLPRYEGYEWKQLGRDVILVAIATGIVYEILENVLD
ncbi:RcnB family protein [Pseudomonas stutzeri]|uniref:anti-virulence regulator CigR family protein n=1 Tax=Stutzerimonas stutzeri TaxID=316 RepID=UPI001E3F7162|nr:anti-virulence regulator CigR family protein [Stutzerimonas stutzeri]MCC8341285.1 RcnB family protein [Stutzerimonas stutzeri]